MKTGTDFFIKCWCCSYQKKLQYLESAAGINIYNHKRTGLLGYEDVSQTKNPIHHQFTGILGVMFTNSYLAMNYFKKLSLSMFISKRICLNKWLFTILMRRLEVVKILIKYKCKTKWPVLVHCKSLHKGQQKQKNSNKLL